VGRQTALKDEEDDVLSIELFKKELNDSSRRMMTIQRVAHLLNDDEQILGENLEKRLEQVDDHHY
jgi:hypothetical protein